MFIKYFQDDAGHFSMMRLLTAVMVCYCLTNATIILTVWTVVSLQSGKIQPMPENFLMFLIGGSTGSIGLKAWQKFAEVKAISNNYGFGSGNYFNDYSEPQRVDDPDA